MAEVIVNLVLGKLADAVVQEALSLYGVLDKAKQVQRQLEWIQAFLKDADAKRHKDERVKQWVKEIREVGDLIEDVLDKFLEEVGKGKSEGLRNVLKRIGKMPAKMISKHKLGSEIDKINQRIFEITENRKKYGIEELKESSSAGASVMLPVRPFDHPDIDELEVVGFEVDKKIIVNQLIDTNTMRRAVITIVGAGGSGKTTLAKEVYKSSEVKRHFDISIWLTISQDYKLSSILMKLLKELKELKEMKELKENGSERQNEEEEYLIIELNKCMRERKYLVVLDDVWSSDVWTQLQVALPNANKGSRVIITSRFAKTAEDADIESKAYEIKPLNEEEGKQLLLKKIFPNHFANECPDNLFHLATQFAKKCRGWPLSLVVLGGILSRKNPNYVTWYEVMQKMDWQTDGSSFMGVISTSYEDLPASLKPCFMYFGVFPEDYQIKSTTLIQLWIAEGFIQQHGTKLLEDIAESYLEELVQRCMVQVSRRSCIGKIKCCHIHDLLRDLAIQKAKENNFLTVYSENDTKLGHSTCARRVARHGCGHMIEHACSKNVHSLINFGCVRNINRFGTLRVLHLSILEDIFSYETSYFKGLNALTALKYFRIGEDPSYRWYCGFPTIIHFTRSPLANMTNLKTVHTCFCKSYGELPPSFWDNKLLSHIIFFICDSCREVPEGPPSATDLQSLLTLKGVKAGQDWFVKLPNFPNIRKLGIVVPIDVAGEPLINLLSNLNYLGSLHLEMSKDNPITFPDCISSFRKHNCLHSFYLENGIWPRKEVVDLTVFPPHLVKLTLWFVNFEEDLMPQLEKLPNLRVLKLCGSSIEVADRKQMICSRGGFGRLHRLTLHVYELEEWKIEEGAMFMLNHLSMECWQLEIVPNLQYLVNLEEFDLDCSEAVNSRLQGEDEWKIKHIPSVIIK